MQEMQNKKNAETALNIKAMQSNEREANIHIQADEMLASGFINIEMSAPTRMGGGMENVHVENIEIEDLERALSESVQDVVMLRSQWRDENRYTTRAEVRLRPVYENAERVEVSIACLTDVAGEMESNHAVATFDRKDIDAALVRYREEHPYVPLARQDDFGPWV